MTGANCDPECTYSRFCLNFAKAEFALHVRKGIDASHYTMRLSSSDARVVRSLLPPKQEVDRAEQAIGMAVS